MPAIETLLAENREAIEALVARAERETPTWETLAAPLEALNDRLSRAWSPVSHLNGTMNNEALRQAYETSLGLLSDYSTWLGQHEGLFRAWQALKGGPAWAELDEGQRRTVDNALRDFRLAGVDLPPSRSAATARSSRGCRASPTPSPTSCWTPPRPGTWTCRTPPGWPACPRAPWPRWRPTPRPRAARATASPWTSPASCR